MCQTEHILKQKEMDDKNILMNYLENQG